MRFTEITRLGSLIILASFMALLIGSNGGTAYAQHTITINNHCSETIWVGAFPNISSGTVGGNNITTPGGWEMTQNQSATVQVPATWSGGRFWARTGCSFNAQGTCDNQKVTVNGNDYVIANCCDTGGCLNGSNFALNCAQTGLPPATLAELTVVSSGQDSYDVSMVDGGNVAVEIIPSSSTYSCTGNANCINTLILPGTSSATCSQDSDCYQLFGFGYKWKCDPTLKLCVNPFFCGSPGCTATGGCAPSGITKSVLPPSPWTGSVGLAVSQANCPSELRLTKDQNQGSTYVGCFAPQKFCRKTCGIDGDCGPPYTFNCGSSGYCEQSKADPVILGADCDTTVAATGTTASTTKFNLWQCAGANAGSCFTPGTNANCCGCPSWAPGWPNAAPTGACVAGNNPVWQTNAQPIALEFNNSSPTSYAFPYDDTIKLFMCQASTGQTTSYTVNFCPNDSDGDAVQNSQDLDPDNDGIPNTVEAAPNILLFQGRTVSTQTEIPDDPDGDGIPNELDLDSDGDGIPDHFEAGGTNDVDKDGTVDNFKDVDGDGHHDSHDVDQGGTPLPLHDTDSDGIPDFLDEDSDGDGICDVLEAGGIDDDRDCIHDDSEDLNADGLADSVSWFST